MTLLKHFLVSAACCCLQVAVFAATNPLARFDSSWNNSKYTSCNTAAQTPWLSPLEKEIIYVLNLVRQHPRHFNETVVKQWPAFEGEFIRKSRYYQSLIQALETAQPVSMLQPDSAAWISARCHAITAGKKGYLGHTRQEAYCTQVKKFNGECCQYGLNDAVEIVMNLLIDEDIPDLGHRIIILKDRYKGIGVSFQPHHTYRYNTVLDFTYQP